MTESRAAGRAVRPLRDATPSPSDGLRGQRRRLTINDIARYAGVSVSTVSRVIRDSSDVGHVTRARITKVIQDTGYRPSYVARALVSGTSRTLGLLVSDITNPFYPQLAKSVESEARARGYALVICNTGDEAAESVAYVHRLLDQRVDGIIHASTGPDEDAVIAAVGDTRRIVFTNRRPKSQEASYVVADNEGGAAILARHLIVNGHRRLGFISGPGWASNSRERLAGMRSAAEEMGAELLVAPGDFRDDAGKSAITEWMSGMGTLPDAIVAVNDRAALSVLATLAELRIDVPARVAVAGFDNISLASSTLIGLTTVAQPIEDLGRRSVRLLLNQLAGRRRPPVRVVLQSRLHVRGTTTPAIELVSLAGGSLGG